MIIQQSGSIVEKLKYTYEISQELIYNNDYRNDILQIILQIYAKNAGNQYLDITLCQFLLNNSEALSHTLINIIKNEVF